MIEAENSTRGALTVDQVRALSDFDNGTVRIVGGDTERHRWLIGGRPAPDIDNQPRVRDLNVPRRALAIASAQNAATEDLLIKIDRSIDVGDGDEMRNDKPVARRHLVALWFDWCAAHLVSPVFQLALSGRLRFSCR